MPKDHSGYEAHFLLTDPLPFKKNQCILRAGGIVALYIFKDNVGDTVTVNFICNRMVVINLFSMKPMT